MSWGKFIATVGLFGAYEITPIKESDSVSYLLFSTDFKKIKIFAEI